MFDSHLAHFKIVGDLVALCKLPHTLTVLRRLNVLVRHKMIRHKRDLILVEYTVHVHLLHLLDGYRTGDIIAQHQIKIGLDQLSRFHMIQPRMCRQNFLCHCHSHTPVLLTCYSLTAFCSSKTGLIRKPQTSPGINSSLLSLHPWNAS